jgi:hypothetical protein
MRITPALRMQATRALRSSGHPDPKNGMYDFNSVVRRGGQSLTTKTVIWADGVI